MSDFLRMDADNAMRALRTFINTEVPTKVDATSQQIARYALDTAIEFSPYVTGRFLASWRIALGALPDPSEAGPGRRSEADAANASRAASSLALGQVRRGVSFTISNSSPYAYFVENGSATSQPHYITRRVAQAVGGRFGRIT